MCVSKIMPCILGAVVAGCAGNSTALVSKDACKSPSVPSQLLLLGDKCDGKTVRVEGYLRVGAEKNGLWDSEEDIQNANFLKSCVTLYNSRGIDMSGPVRKVTVDGVFMAERPDRLVILGACTDAILDVRVVSELLEK